MDIYSSAVNEIVTRLTWHTATATPARLLAGWSFVDRPMSRVDGVRDFPSIAIGIPEIAEDFRARHYGTALMKLDIYVSTKTTDTVMTHTAAVALALDAIECRATSGAELDAGLVGTLLKPFDVSIANAQIAELAVTSKVTLSLAIKAFNRGNRRRV